MDGGIVLTEFLGGYFLGARLKMGTEKISSHPLSVDALCNLPADIANVDTHSTILTGSSDGYVRAVQILPTKLLGVVADHGEWPIERIAVGGGHGQLSIEQNETPSDRGNSLKIGNRHKNDEDTIHGEADHQRRWWVGSVGHEDVLRMTDLEGFFRDNEGSEDNKGALGVDVSGAEDSDIEQDDEQDEISQQEPPKTMTAELTGGGAAEESYPDSGDGEDSDSDSSDEEPQPQARKRKAEKGLPMTAIKKKKGKNSVVVEPSFFDEL